jgi:hypothetical protein
MGRVQGRTRRGTRGVGRATCICLPSWTPNIMVVSSRMLDTLHSRNKFVFEGVSVFNY